MKTISKSILLFMLCLATSLASAQMPVLNSFSASDNVIFLDFDGHTVTGTSWNSNGPIVCDAVTLNATQITTVFNRVAEDYRPFAVNVTTDSANYWAAPANKRMRIILTPSSSWYGSAGGVAFVNSFSWGDNTPCFVFTALLNNNTKNIAEAASHEVGHTLGLRHQSSYDAFCNKTSEYNAGRGVGEIGWAPIMGVGYYQNMTLWNYGANPFGCTAYQDDLSMITGSNGVAFRTDDFTSIFADAAAINFSNNASTITGIIERPNDADVVKFSLTQSTRLRLQALPYSLGTNNAGSNIDLEIQLNDNFQTVIGVYNEASSLHTSIDTVLNAGTYYIVVRGQGNIYAPNYASLGSYTLAAQITPGNTLPLHKLQLKGVTENKQHKLDWEIIADEKVVTQTLEASNNGINFNPVSSPDAGARAHTYAPLTANLLYYRLKVLFDNGRHHYSNVVALRNNGSNRRPYLISNVVTGVLTISSPSGYAYTIHDVSGRTVAKGNLVQGVNTIYLPFSTNGMYIMQYQNAAEFYTEKFSKR